MLNNNSEQFPPPVMSHHRPFDPTTSTTGMAQTNNASTAAVNSEVENSNHHLNPHQQQHHHNININTTPVDPINPTTTSSSSSPADDVNTTLNNTNTNTAINILHHFKNGLDEMMESGGVIEPLPTDVICGRGKMTSSHPANRRFRELVDFHKRAYQNSKRRDEKTRITCDLVDKLRSEGR